MFFVITLNKCKSAMNFCCLCGNVFFFSFLFLKIHCANVLPRGQIYCGAHSLTLPLLRLPVIYGCLFCIKEDVVDNKTVKFHKLRLQTLETVTFGIASRKINSKSMEIMCLHCDVNKAEGKAF